MELLVWGRSDGCGGGGMNTGQEGSSVRCRVITLAAGE